MIPRIVSLILLFTVGFCVVAEAYDPVRFEREVLVPGSRDALQLEVLANGDIVFVEFAGGVKWWEAKSGTVKTCLLYTSPSPRD